MWLVAWTLNRGGNDLPDFWVIRETEHEARTQYAHVLTLDNLHCAAMAPIAEATEPHWTEGEEREDLAQRHQREQDELTDEEATLRFAKGQ
jgi:hypothetical protein